MAVAMTETEGTDWEEAVRTNADLIRKLVGLSKETINGELSPKQKHDRAMTLIDMDATLFDLETNLFDMVKEPVVATPDGPPEDMVARGALLDLVFGGWIERAGTDPEGLVLWRPTEKLGMPVADDAHI